MNQPVLWRLSPAYRAPMAMSGEGAFRRGGRWSPAGVRVIYCAESRSLALVEVLANLRRPGFVLGRPWVVIEIAVPADLIERSKGVPPTWRETPYTAETQAFGAEWVQARRSAVLRVPSAVVPGEFNYMLNPAHPDFTRVTIGKPQPFNFDPRLA